MQAARKPEIAELDIVVAVQEKIAEFEAVLGNGLLPVQHKLAMQVLQRCEDLQAVATDVPLIQTVVLLAAFF